VNVDVYLLCMLQLVCDAFMCTVSWLHLSEVCQNQGFVLLPDVSSKLLIVTFIHIYSGG